jgi:hypothetical protein
MTKKPKVVITVENGVVQEVYSVNTPDGCRHH